MATVNVRIDGDAFSDPRVELLGMLAGYNRFEALGRLAHLWRVCVVRQTDTLEDVWLRACLGNAGPEWLVKAELGEAVAGGTRVLLAPAPAEKPDGFVYFISDPPSGTVKIGHSASPEARLRQLQTSVPNWLRLLGSLPGDQFQERDYHRQFARQRIREDGEWFRIEGELLAFLKAQGWM